MQTDDLTSMFCLKNRERFLAKKLAFGLLLPNEGRYKVEIYHLLLWINDQKVVTKVLRQKANI